MSEKRVAIVTGSSSGIGPPPRRNWRAAAGTGRQLPRAPTPRRKSFRNAWRSGVRGCRRAGRRVEVDDCKKLAKTAIDRWAASTRGHNAGSTKFVPHAKLDGLSGEDVLAHLFDQRGVELPDVARLRRGAKENQARGAIVNISSIAAQWGNRLVEPMRPPKGAELDDVCAGSRDGPGGARQRGAAGLRRHALADNHYGAEKAAEHAKAYASRNPLNAS